MMTRFFSLLIALAADARTRRALEETMRDAEVELTQRPAGIGRLAAHLRAFAALGRVLVLTALEEAADGRVVAIAGRTTVAAVVVLACWLAPLATRTDVSVASEAFGVRAVEGDVNASSIAELIRGLSAPGSMLPYVLLSEISWRGSIVVLTPMLLAFGTLVMRTRRLARWMSLTVVCAVYVWVIVLRWDLRSTPILVDILAPWCPPAVIAVWTWWLTGRLNATSAVRSARA